MVNICLAKTDKEDCYIIIPYLQIKTHSYHETTKKEPGRQQGVLNRC